MTRWISIKLKLTLWIICFMTLTAAACMGLMLGIRRQVESSEAFKILNLTVRTNIPEVSLTDGRLNLSEDFNFYINDVYLLIYNKNGALLSGQAPPSFPMDTLLENGIAKSVFGQSDQFHVLDFWIPSGWEDGVWLRGVTQSHDSRREFGNIFSMFTVIFPFFLLFAAVGGYLIAKKALAPISYITEAADTISGGQDLTRRIGLPKGSDEVSHLANAFDHMFEALEQSFEAEKQFTSDASHELRTPVSVILAQCDYAKKHGDSLEDYEEAIDVIHRQARRMSQLIERLLDMTRLDLGTRTLQMQLVDLSDMAAIICQEMDNGNRGISLTTQIQKGVFIQADSFLISRVIMNLIENARKYGKENGHIVLSLSLSYELVETKECSASSSDFMAVLQVKDDGIGISPEHLDKIWQRFYQVNQARQSDSGLGLGLSMVYQIIRLHNGQITATSTLGKGSCFTVKLPAVSAEDAPKGETKVRQVQWLISLISFFLLLLSGCTKNTSIMDYIGIQAAKEAALKDADISSEQAVFTMAELDNKNNIFYYQIIFTENGTEYRYDIDALTGVIIEKNHFFQVSEDTEISIAETAPPIPSEKETESFLTEPEQTIDAETALSIALSYAGLTKDDIVFSNVKIEMEHSRKIYDVEFFLANGTEYDYELNVEDGTVISFDYDAESSFQHLPPASGGIISESQAMQTILSRVPGAKESDVLLYLDEDDGRLEYKGELIFDNMKYEFKIDAYSGGLIEWEAELLQPYR